MTRRTIALFALSLLAGCFAGGDDDVPGPESGPLTDDDIRAVCELTCEKQVRCGSSSNQAACESECFAEGQTASTWMRADGVLAVVECQSELPCQSEELESCFGACQPTASHTRFEAACRQTMAPCWDPEQLNNNCSVRHIEGVSDSGFICLVLPAIMDEMTACMNDSASCDAANICVQDVFDRHMINF